MKQLLRRTVLVLLWLALCVLFLSGCHATAPAETVAELGGINAEVERSFLESLYLFVGTDYGEFCAFVACGMAAHVLLLLKMYLYPWLCTHAPRLAAWLKRLLIALSAFVRKDTRTSASLPSDLLPPFTEDTEDESETGEAPEALPPSVSDTDADAAEDTAEDTDSTP